MNLGARLPGVGWLAVGLLAFIRGFLVVADSALVGGLVMLVGLALIGLAYRLLVAPTRRMLGASAVVGLALFLFSLPGLATANGQVGIVILLVIGATAVMSLAAARGRKDA